VARTFRQPQLVIGTLVFPLLMLAILTDVGSHVTKIPHFPTKSYITFVLASTLVQGAVNGTTVAGQQLASDFETGFVNRILLTPARQSVLLVAQLAGVLLVGLMGSVLFLCVGLIFGASIKVGVAGALVVLAISTLVVLMFGALGLLGAVLTRSATKIQALFSIFLGLFFMSSMLMPRNLMKAGWFKDIATYNPISYLIEAPRSLIVTGWDAQAIALGCGVAVAGLILAIGTSVTIMRRSLERV
jgi:ABC-2 type transport system permease protein